jgi:membrane-bound ClpP family serine protease
MLILILLLSFGILLLVLDIAFIPGMFVGAIGALLIIAGVFTAYSSISITAGHITLIGSILFMFALLYYIYKIDVWSRFSLKDTIDARVNDDLNDIPNKGEIGIALSALRPVGKAEFNNKTIEVHTLGQYCEAGSVLEVINIENRRVTVRKQEV